MVCNFTADNVDEKLLIGYNNSIGPRCMIVFLSEESSSPEDIKELTGRVMRTYDVVIERGKSLTYPRNLDMTKTYGPSRPFYDLVEEARNVIRCIIWPTPMVYNPTIYNSIRPGRQNEKYDWLIDSYIINFSILLEIGRIQTIPPQLGTGPFLQLSDPLNIVLNQSPDKFIQ